MDNPTGYLGNIGDLATVPWAVQPTVQTVTAGITAVQIVKANPYRTCLLMSAQGAGTVILSTNPSVTVAIGGIALTANQPLIIFTAADHGLIPTLQWFAVAGGNIVIAFIELVVSSFDQNGSNPKLIQRADAGEFYDLVTRRTNRQRRAAIHSDSWRQRQEIAPYDISNISDSRLG